jgi:hypothetical protein
LRKFIANILRKHLVVQICSKYCGLIGIRRRDYKGEIVGHDGEILVASVTHGYS